MAFALALTFIVNVYGAAVAYVLDAVSAIQAGVANRENDGNPASSGEQWCRPGLGECQ